MNKNLLFTVFTPRIFLFTIFVCFFGNSFFAQKLKIIDIIENGNQKLKEKKLDEARILYEKSLKIALEKGYADTIGLIYNNMGIVSWKKKNYQNAIYQYKQGLKYDSLGARGADFHYNISLAQRKIGKKDSSLFYLKKSLKIYNKLKVSRGAYNVFLNAGKVFKRIQQYDISLQYLLKAYQGFLDLNDLKKVASTADMIAQVQDDLGNLEKAYQYYFESLNNRLKIGDSTSIAYSYNNIGTAYFKEKNHDSAIFYYTKALDFKKKRNLSYAKTLFNLGISFHTNGEKKKAINTFERALVIKKKYRDTLSILYTINELIFANTEIKNFKAAKTHIKSSTEFLKNMEVPRVIYRNYDLQSHYYSKIDSFKKAYELQRKSAELYVSIFNQQQAKIVQEIQEKYKSKAKENDNLKLKLKNEENKVIISNQKSSIRNKNFWIAFLLLLGLLLLAAYLFLRQRQLAMKREREYVRLKSIYEGQETIKNGISKDLHDVVGASLSGAKLKLEALSNSKNRGNLEKDLKITLSKIDEQIRLISHRLSPLGESIRKYAFSEIIVSYLSEFQYYNNVKVEFRNNVAKEIDKLTLFKQTNLYGILLELLNNISKHANASLVKIAIDKDKLGMIKLLVKDNGLGFNTKECKGIGLINIEQRTKLLKGTSFYSNSENGGVQFELKFSLKDDE